MDDSCKEELPNYLAELRFDGRDVIPDNMTPEEAMKWIYRAACLRIQEMDHKKCPA